MFSVELPQASVKNYIEKNISSLSPCLQSAFGGKEHLGKPDFGIISTYLVRTFDTHAGEEEDEGRLGKIYVH